MSTIGGPDQSKLQSLRRFERPENVNECVNCTRIGSACELLEVPGSNEREDWAFHGTKGQTFRLIQMSMEEGSSMED